MTAPCQIRSRYDSFPVRFVPGTIRSRNPFAKILQRPQLQLLNRSLTASQFRCHLAQTLLSHEAPENHLFLVGGQGIDQLIEHAEIAQKTKNTFFPVPGLDQ